MKKENVLYLPRSKEPPTGSMAAGQHITQAVTLLIVQGRINEDSSLAQSGPLTWNDFPTFEKVSGRCIETPGELKRESGERDCEGEARAVSDCSTLVSHVPSDADSRLRRTGPFYYLPAAAFREAFGKQDKFLGTQAALPTF